MSGTCSVANRLPGALSSVMLSNNLSWACGGRYISSPSAIHAVGWPASKPLLQQRFRPVLTQIDTDRASIGGRFDAQVGKRAGLELDNVRLVDLVDDGAVRPRQPVGARIQPGGQDDGLAHAGGGGIGEQPVEEPGAHGHSLCRSSAG